MLHNVAGFVVWAADEIPPDNVMAQLIVPIGILAFLGSTYLLLRSSLGTRRAYLVLATCTFGFMLIMSLFWGFGAPGTPQATGPTNLPGQVQDALRPKWVPFAQDSLLADREDLQVVKSYPEGFEVDGWPADMEIEDADDNVNRGAEEIQNFFSTEEAGQVVDATWAIEEMAYTETSSGLPLLAVTFREVDEALQPDPDGETYTAFSFFDAGNPLLPSYIFIGIALLGLLVHGWLLDRDEQREKRLRARAKDAAAEREPVGAGA